jgi:uncharacterized protein (DUF2225 family)
MRSKQLQIPNKVVEAVVYGSDAVLWASVILTDNGGVKRANETMRHEENRVREEEGKLRREFESTKRE